MKFFPFPFPKELGRFVPGLLLAVVVPFSQPSYANPTGPTIRHGDIVISGSGSQLRILQSTSRGVIDWNTFSISEGEVTRFLQPGASAATLNRVTGQSISRIDGSLLANGRVFLLNPNGILVGRNGIVDTAGFTASTLDLSDQDFLAGGDLRFRGNSRAGVVNLGSITAFDGDVFLIAESVLNEGSISARNGTVGLAAGNDVLIAESGSERVFVRGAGTAGKDSGVINRGTVEANIAELKSYGGNIYGMAVRNEGRIAATAVSREGGQIFLRAGGGRVRTTGTLTARNDDGGGNVEVNSGEGGSTDIGGTVNTGNAAGEGGDIFILGSEINLFEGSLLIADGATDGGRVFVGGGRRGRNPDFNNATNVTAAENAILSANAGDSGDGGEIIVFAENRLEFSGSLSATGGSIGGDGGFAELSGKKEIVIPDLSSRVDLTATSGKSGTLLFDPNNIVIEEGAAEEESSVTGSPVSSNVLFADDISNFLEGTGPNSGMSLIIETDSEGSGGNGDIFFVSGATIEWSTNSDFTIKADRDYLQTSGSQIVASGGGGVFVSAGRSIQLTGSGTSIETASGAIELDGNMGSTQLSGNFSGVVLDEAEVSSMDGAITVSGKGGAGAFGNRGILLRQNASITSAGNGSITLWGSAGAGSDGQLQGVGLVNSLIETGTGNISITGHGAGVIGTPAEANMGIDLFASTIRSNTGGNIVLQGTAGDSPATAPGAEAVGIRLISSSSIETIGGGSIALTGVSGASPDSVGLRLNSTPPEESESEIGIVSDTGHILIETDSIELTGGILKSAGELTIRPLTDGANIDLGNGTPGSEFSLDGNELSFFADGFQHITIGREFGYGTFHIGQSTFFDPVSLLMPISGGEFVITGDLSGEGDASILIEGAGSDFGEETETATTYLSANIRTMGNAITIRDDLVLEGDAALDTTWQGAFSDGADIEIDGTVEGSDPGENEFANFAVDAGGMGEIRFLDSVGSSGYLGDIDLRSRTITLDQSLDANGKVEIRTVEGLEIGANGFVYALGDILLEGNRVGEPRMGDFHGVEINSVVDSYYGTVTIRGTGGSSSGNTGVLLNPGSDVIAGGNVMIEGGAQSSLEKGVEARGSVMSYFGDAGFATTGGSLDVGGTVDAYSSIQLNGAASEDTEIFVTADLQTFLLDVNGGGGMNLLDFSGFDSSDVSLDADQLSGIHSVKGSGGNYDSFGGSFSAEGTFEFTDANSFTYSAGPSESPETIDVTGFESVYGGSLADTFVIDVGSEVTFDGALDGDGGNDVFQIRSGSVSSIFGGSEDSQSGDILDFSPLAGDIMVDLNLESASFVDFFTGIETVVGSSGVSTIQGTPEDDDIAITGDGMGAFTIPAAFPATLAFGESENEKEGGFSTFKLGSDSTLFFEGFDIVSGAGGNDEFTVQMPSAETFSGTLRGDAGEDSFVISPGGGVAEIDGGSETDTLDFSLFHTPVSVDIGSRSATQVQEFREVESVVGGSAQDTLSGRPVNDQFLVTSNGGGFLNSGQFSSFEILRGQGGADQFVFRNQATVAQAIGGPGSDTFTIDDTTLGGTNTYTISGNTVSRNPFYLFTEMEFLQLFLGPGNDTVLVDDNGLVHSINGGGGSNTIDFGSTPVSGLTPFLLGTTQVFATNFDNILLVRDESNNPENINPTAPGTGNLPGQGSQTDQFSNTSGLGQALGNAFGAMASNALIAGQASLLQVEGGQVEAPLSLDGFFTSPPQSIVQTLQESLQVGAWTELANAIGFGGATILVRSDGPYSILLDEIPPNELLSILQQSLQPEAGRELLEALELTVVIPITSAEGAVSILAVPVQLDPAVLQQLGFNLNDAALSELTTALGE